MRKLLSVLVGIIVITVLLAGCSGTATTSATKPVSPASSSAAPQASTSVVPSTSTSAAPTAKPSATSSAASTTAVATGSAFSQYKRTVGLFKNDVSKAYPGYTLFSPKHMGSTYLIDNNGQMINKWSKSQYEPGQSFYLRENGNLVRCAMTRGPLSSGGGEGGRIEEYDWDGNLVWATDFSDANKMQHHDIVLLPNGNILMLVVEKKTYPEVLKAGFNPKLLEPGIKSGYMVPDSVYEIKPKMPTGSDIVWSWHVWDHLVQDFDPAQDNYGVVKDHPELVNPNGFNTDFHTNQVPKTYSKDSQVIHAFWNHMNSITYNTKWDQIMLSVRGNSEVWVIDHGTTTEQAKGHTGGQYNKGGDLLYRWGNSWEYEAGTIKDAMLFQQHNAIWIADNLPGAGDMMVYNNGISRNYSSVDQWTPPVDAKGNYTLVPGQAYGPTKMTWEYKATPPESMYDEAISGAQRLPNGNTLVCSGTHGRFIETNPAGETVWEYWNPVATKVMGYADIPPSDQARGEEFMNACFRVTRYPVDFPGFKGKDMTPKGVIETDTPPVTPAPITPRAPGGGQGGGGQGGGQRSGVAPAPAP